MNNKIDIIIPAYNVKDDLLFNCLSSIATQSVKKDIQVTIVDDASTQPNYKQVSDLFSHILNIQILRLEKNCGPGVARQYGLDNTNNEFILFLDTDDMLINGIAIEQLRQALENNEKSQIVQGKICQTQYINKEDEKPYLTLIDLGTFSNVLHGKMYRRSFLKQYNIRFHPTARYHEDRGFNTLCWLYMQSNGHETTILDNYIYLYQDNKNSMTRNDSHFMGSFQDIYNFVDNFQNIFSIAINDDKVNKYILTIQVAESLVVLYLYYINLIKEERINETNKSIYINEFKKIYIFFKQVQKYASPSIINPIYTETFSTLYSTGSLNYIPQITFFDFLKLLEI